jgi:hypothetical protein
LVIAEDWVTGISAEMGPDGFKTNSISTSGSFGGRTIVGTNKLLSLD